MKLLLDTHIVLWALNDDPALKPAMRTSIQTAEVVFVSAVSIWEIAVKRSLGKLEVPDNLAELVLRAGCQPLPISWAHAADAGQLPRHHKDPFDHLLIAQARCEGLALATVDRMFRQYKVDLL